MQVKQFIFRVGISLFVVFGIITQISAQEQISDKELEGYVMVMDSVDAMKKSLNLKLNDMVKNNEHLTTKRYNEIKQGTGNPATEEEQKAYDAILAEVAKETKAIQEKSQAMIKDKSLLGALPYNKIRKALKTVDKTKIEARMKVIREEKGTTTE